jgi:hypothetical protein
MVLTQSIVYTVIQHTPSRDTCLADSAIRQQAVHKRSGIQ